MKKSLAVLFFLFPLTLSAQTATSTTVALEALIKQLQARITELQAQVQSLKTELKITRVLTQGIRGEDVKQLQEFLKTIPDVYPEGLVTGYFGPLTKAAVQRFQEKQRIVTPGSPETTGFGVVGPRTISKINELISTGAGTSGVVPPGLAPTGSTLPPATSVTGSVTGSAVSQTQTTSIAPAQSAVTTTSVSTTTSSTSSTSATGAPSMSFGASPVSISAGQSSTLTLSSSGAYGGCYGQGTFSGQTSGSVVVSPATTTSYSVTCYAGTGQQSGLTTTVIPVVFVAPASTSGTSAISTPLNFSMSGGVSSLSVRWSATDSTVVTGYRVYVKNTNTNTSTAYNYDLNVIATILNGIAPGDYSAYIVATVNNDTESAPSPTVTATVTGQLTAPSNFSASATGPTSVSLTWSASQGSVSYYTIDRNICSSCGAEAAFSVQAPGTSYTDNGVKAATAYTYKMRAIGTNFSNQSESVSASVTTPAASSGESATTSSLLPNPTPSQIAAVLEAMQRVLNQIQEFIKQR